MKERDVSVTCGSELNTWSTAAAELEGLCDTEQINSVCSETCLTRMKKDFTMLLALLPSGWPPSPLMAVWMIRTMSSLKSSWQRKDRNEGFTYTKYKNTNHNTLINTCEKAFFVSKASLTPNKVKTTVCHLSLTLQHYRRVIY